MGLSSAQWVGVASVIIIIGGSILILGYMAPRISALFRPALRNAVYWSIVLLVLQTMFILFSTVNN